MNVRQNFKNLRNHTDYSFKNKQLFREKQNKVADIILLRISATLYSCTNTNSSNWKCFEKH